jgi:hypothetical protein
MALEARLACGALALGLALVVIALFEGCDWGGEPTGGAEDAAVGRPANDAQPPVSRDPYDALEALPGCPERTRHLNFDHATISASGRAVRIWFAASSSYVPCGFAAGDNGRVMVLELRATNPRVALADLNGRCLDAVLESRAEKHLDVLSTHPSRGPDWTQKARAKTVGPDGDCPDVRPSEGATIEVD